jgi:N,N'-diacetyllegionaminate synthase
MPSLEVIAEAAQGYAGEADKQRFMLRSASAAGADSVKFQLVYADELATSDYEHYATFTRSQMEPAAWRELAALAGELDIKLYLDVFGDRSLAVAVDAGADGIKLHSSDALNVALIEAVAQAPVDRVVLSTGGGHQSEIRAAVELLQGKSLVLMHGFQGYPTRDEDNQIARLRWLRDEFPGHDIGFADHVPFDADERRLWLAAVAIGAGANVVEKHLTTALALREVDYHAALAPDDFKRFVDNMRIAAAAFGSDSGGDDFGMSESEANYRKGLKKQVVARRDLPSGHTLAVGDLVLKRTPITDDVVYDLAAALGRSLTADVAAERPITHGALG